MPAGPPGARRIEIGVNQPKRLEFVTFGDSSSLAMPTSITSEFRNQLKMLYRFGRGGTRRFMSLPPQEPISSPRNVATNARRCVLSTRVGARSVVPAPRFARNRSRSRSIIARRTAIPRTIGSLRIRPARRSEPVGEPWAGVRLAA